MYALEGNLGELNPRWNAMRPIKRGITFDCAMRVG